MNISTNQNSIHKTMEVIKVSELKDMQNYVFICGYSVRDGCSATIFKGRDLLGSVNNGKFFCFKEKYYPPFIFIQY